MIGKAEEIPGQTGYKAEDIIFGTLISLTSTLEHHFFIEDIHTSSFCSEYEQSDDELSEHADNDSVPFNHFPIS